jgi:hypothetical protein
VDRTATQSTAICELKTLVEFGQLKADNMSRMKETYASLAIEPDHTRYG